MAANTFSEPGYTFAGWNDGAATYAAGATYTLASNGSAIVLTATWTANATDAYSYDAGTGTGSAPAAGRVSRHHHHLGRQHLQRAGLHLRRLERRRRHLRRRGHLHLGQQRLGHRLDRHLDGQRHRAYSYDAGTGTGSAPAAGSGLDGTTITLAANTFSEPGYTFAGWNDGAATYAAGHLHLGQQRLGHRLDRHLDGQRHRRLLL